MWEQQQTAERSPVPCCLFLWSTIFQLKKIHACMMKKIDINTCQYQIYKLIKQHAFYFSLLLISLILNIVVFNILLHKDVTVLKSLSLVHFNQGEKRVYVFSALSNCENYTCIFLPVIWFYQYVLTSKSDEYTSGRNNQSESGEGSHDLAYALLNLLMVDKHLTITEKKCLSPTLLSMLTSLHIYDRLCCR